MSLLVSCGIGFTLTVRNVGAPTQPAGIVVNTEVGITVKTIVPTRELPVLVSVGLIGEPAPERVADVTEAVFDTVQLNVLNVEVLSATFMSGPAPLQICVTMLLICGNGFTDTVIRAGTPKQNRGEVGTTLYTTVPIAELLGLCRLSLIIDEFTVLNEPPVMPPVTLLCSHVYVEAGPVVADKETASLESLHRYWLVTVWT